ncbi:MAG: MFS transporter [Parachlamydiales bacterium]
MRRSIFSSFAFLNATQFLGALNDNIFRLTTVFLGIGLLGEGKTNLIVLIAGAFFVAPFILFSLPSGTLADRISKRTILVAMKGAEVIIMALGMASFYYQTLWGAYAVLFLMAAQSAVFGPAKYGIVPELVSREKIAIANGILTGATVIATILGVLLASLLTDLTHRNLVLVGAFCTAVALLGLFTSLAIEKTPPAGSTSKINAHLFSQILRVMKRARGENYLFTSILGSAYFYLIGSFVQLNSLPFTIENLGLTDVQSGYLFSVAALGIAVGAFLAGKLSGRYVELGLSPITGLILGLFFCFTELGAGSIIAAILLLAFLGGLGGMFLVPFDAYTQSASLDHERGENVSAANFLAFIGVLLSVGLFYLSSTLFHLSSIGSFRVMGIVTIAISLSLSLRLTDTFVRLAARLLHFRPAHRQIQGADKISHHHPTLFLCSTPTPEAGLLFMIILQQRYMRLVIEEPEKPSPLFRFVCRLAKVGFYQGAITPGGPVGPKAALWLKRGYSVALLPRKPESISLASLAQTLAKERHVDLLHIRLTAKGPGRWAPPMRAVIS